MYNNSSIRLNTCIVYLFRRFPATIPPGTRARSEWSRRDSYIKNYLTLISTYWQIRIVPSIYIPTPYAYYNTRYIYVRTRRRYIIEFTTTPYDGVVLLLLRFFFYDYYSYALEADLCGGHKLDTFAAIRKNTVHNTCNISINNKKTNARDIYPPLCNNSCYRARFSGTKRRAKRSRPSTNYDVRFSGRKRKTRLPPLTPTSVRTHAYALPGTPDGFRRFLSGTDGGNATSKQSWRVCARTEKRTGVYPERSVVGAHRINPIWDLSETCRRIAGNTNKRFTRAERFARAVSVRATVAFRKPTQPSRRVGTVFNMNTYIYICIRICIWIRTQSPSLGLLARRTRSFWRGRLTKKKKNSRVTMHSPYELSYTS